MRRLLEKVKKDLKACAAKKDFQGANYLKMQLAKLKAQVNKQEKSFMASKQSEQIQLLNKAKIAIAGEVKQACDAREAKQGLVQQRGRVVRDAHRDELLCALIVSAGEVRRRDVPDRIWPDAVHSLHHTHREPGEPTGNIKEAESKIEQT